MNANITMDLTVYNVVYVSQGGFGTGYAYFDMKEAVEMAVELNKPLIAKKFYQGGYKIITSTMKCGLPGWVLEPSQVQP